MFTLRSQPIAQSTLVVAPRSEWELLWEELIASVHVVDRWTQGEWQKAPVIADLRSLHRHAAQTPVGRYKMAAIPFADSLSRETANSLLKILEEPPHYFWTVLFAQSETVLPTVYSRVRIVRFADRSSDTQTQRERLSAVLGNYDLRSSQMRTEAQRILQLVPLIHATIQLPVIEEAFQPES